MQSLFVLKTNIYSNPLLGEKHLLQSFERYFDFYHYIIFSAWKVANYVQKDAEIKAAKFLPTDADRQVNAKLLSNTVNEQLSVSEDFLNLIKRKHFDSFVDDHVIQSIYKLMIDTDLYEDYLANPLTDAKDDFKFFKQIVFEFMLPNEIFVEHLGDVFLNRNDDGLDVERMLNKLLSKAKKKGDAELLIFSQKEKKKELKEFAVKLFKTTINNQEFLTEEFSKFLANWDASRIARVDSLLIQMALCEMLYFENIPLKVTMNEYIDISKEYSTPKSKEFINGILDKMMKNYHDTGKIVKTGRGLIT